MFQTSWEKNDESNEKVGFPAGIANGESGIPGRDTVRPRPNASAVKSES